MRSKTIFLLRFLLLCLIVLMIGSQSGRVLGYSLQRDRKEIKPPEMAEVRKFFQDAASLERGERCYAVLSSDGKPLGMLLDARRETEEIIGYGGPIPLLVALSSDNRIVGILPGEHEETPEFFDKVIQEKFFEKWNGKSLEEASLLPVDTVTGATMSSLAALQTVKATLSMHGACESKDDSRSPWNRETFVGLAVLLFSLFCFFRPGKMARMRWLLLLANVVALGFYLGWFVAMGQMRGWIVNGIQFGARPALALIVLCAIFLPLFTGKGFYCVYLCPFGSCQDLISKVPLKKRPLLPGLRSVRPMLFAALVFLVVIGVPLNLTNWEPFSAFIPTSASWIVLGLAGLFLSLSLFTHRPWCNIACPTGQFLEIVRNIARKSGTEQKGEDKMRPMEVVSVFLVVALIILLLQTGGMPAGQQQGQTQSSGPSHEVLRIIHQRKSVRKYTDKPVTKEQLEVLLKAAMAAPTAGNKQPWAFVVVTDKATLAKFAEVLPYAKMAAQASAAIVVCGDMNLTFPDEESKPYWVQDCSAASENILLAAEATELGAVWTAVYPMKDRIKAVKEILALPEHIVPLNVIPIGHPTGVEKPKDKYKPENIHREKW